MNITIVTFSLSNNGAERVQSELAEEWSRQGHNVRIVQLRKNAFGSESFTISDNIEIITLKDRSSNKLLKYIFYLRDLLKDFRKHPEDTLVAFSFTTQAIIAMSRPFIKNRIIFSERNDPARCPYTKFTRQCRTLSFYMADVCVFQTEEAKNYFPKGIKKKGVIIPNPINPELPERYAGPRRKVIVTASRLRPQKNLSLLIQAFEIVHRKYVDYTLEIYGIGEEEDRLQNLIRKLRLSDSVHLCGYTTALYEKIVDCAMYVCSSDYEGISNSVLEALGMGLPTISTDCPIGGAREIIDSGNNGILVPTNDITALSEAMLKIIDEPRLANQLSEAAITVKSKYQIDKIAERWIMIMSKSI